MLYSCFWNDFDYIIKFGEIYLEVVQENEFSGINNLARKER